MRLDFEDVYRAIVGKTYKRRMGNGRRQMTLRVIDCTLGGDVIVKERGLPRRFMHQSLFLDWAGTTVEKVREHLFANHNQLGI